MLPSFPFTYADRPVSPVFWFTGVELGGYGFSPRQISLFLGGIGISQAIWLLTVFPLLQRKFGTGNVLRGCYAAYPLFITSLPLCNILLRHNWTTAFWIVAPVCQIVGSGVAMGFSKFVPISCSLPDAHVP